MHDKLFVALHVCGKTPLPQKHCHPRFVGSLEYVLMEHYTVRGCRLSGASPPTRHAIGYCAYSAAEPYKIKCLINDYVVEKLGALVVIDGHMDWVIDSTASVEAQFFSEAAGIRIGSVGLFSERRGCKVGFTTDGYETNAAALLDRDVPSDFAVEQPLAVAKDTSSSKKEVLVRAPLRLGRARPSAVAEPPSAP